MVGNRRRTARRTLRTEDGKEAIHRAVWKRRADRTTASRLAALVTIGGGVRYYGVSLGRDRYDPHAGLYAVRRHDPLREWPRRFQVNASNLADKRHVTTCSRAADCFFGMGRTVLSSLTYRF
jgi:outer membrane receptor protein involved in Fe transport